MNPAWKNETGSALLMVMMGVVIAGILFGGLYVSADNSHKQAVTNREQVMAQYRAQGLMSIALNYYYNNATLFSQKFPSNNSCIDANGNAAQASAYPNVCLSVDANGNQSLVATGTDGSGNSQIGQQIDKLTVSLASGNNTNSVNDGDNVNQK